MRETAAQELVAEGAPAYSLSVAARQLVPSGTVSTIADGMAVRVPDAAALEIILAHATRLVVVTDAEIRNAMRHLFTDTHNVAEAAWAAALAGLLKERGRMRGRRAAVLLSGANVIVRCSPACCPSMTNEGVDVNADPAERLDNLSVPGINGNWLERNMSPRATTAWLQCPSNGGASGVSIRAKVLPPTRSGKRRRLDPRSARRWLRAVSYALLRLGRSQDGP